MAIITLFHDTNNLKVICLSFKSENYSLIASLVLKLNIRVLVAIMLGDNNNFI